jgi:tyrosine-protein phosphatase SIW14
VLTSALPRRALILAIAALLTVVPLAFYRCLYIHEKRLREVTPGRVYRSGQMTADGFAEAIERFHLHTIINLQDEYPDPDVRLCAVGGGTVKESELCEQFGVRYVFLRPDLISRRRVPAHRPRAIDEVLRLLDDPDTYPVLFHCRAGLHRTGVMVAVYRMEYEGWTPGAALEEMRANGFGRWESQAGNDYITQYILTYRRGLRDAEGDDAATAPPGGAAP